MIARFPIRSIFLALAVRVVPATAAEQVPSCDLFRTRLVEAPKVLSLRLPNLQLHREPPDHQDDVWKTNGMRAEDSGELWYTTGVYCRAGKFREVSVAFSEFTPALPRIFSADDRVALPTGPTAIRLPLNCESRSNGSLEE
jgi:hypothetical protein